MFQRRRRLYFVVAKTVYFVVPIALKHYLPLLHTANRHANYDTETGFLRKVPPQWYSTSFGMSISEYSTLLCRIHCAELCIQRLSNMTTGCAIEMVFSACAFECFLFCFLRRDSFPIDFASNYTLLTYLFRFCHKTLHSTPIVLDKYSQI